MGNPEKSWKIMIFPDFRVAFATPTGGPGGVARCHLQGLGMRYDKKTKTKKNWSKLFFSMRKIFRKKIEIDFFSNISLEKKSLFLSITFLVEKQSWLFRDLFRFFHRKKKFWPKLCVFLYRISCPTHASGIAQLPLGRPWARQTQPEIPENPENPLN